ncbi:putative ovule protein [Forsythia ovata]|uniref:Ovule protein n=1 Tax=Forsythia ovata TaxID=205694 RepID=A0ABD1RGI0_9LAMI
MLNKKFFRDGETLLATSTTLGTTMEAVNAPVVKPVTNFSFSEALTSNFPTGFETAIMFEGFMGNGLRKASVFGYVFRVAQVNGITIDTTKVEAAIGYASVE